MYSADPTGSALSYSIWPWRTACIALLLAFALLPILAATATETIPWSELSTQADQQHAPQLPILTLEGDHARLSAPLQALSAVMDAQGLQVESTSSTEGGGTFRLIPIRLDKGAAPWTLGLGTVSTDGTAVILDRGRLQEVLTASTLGLRQDFIVPQPPPGVGSLTLTLALHGASAQQAVENIELTLVEGRKLMYHSLHVIDADGQVLDSAMKTQGDDTLIITVADADARYPLTIDPTITDVDWQVWNPSIPGIDGYIRAMTYDAAAQRLYIGGGFTLIGNVLANSIAQWDGSSWSALGSGLNGTVYALAVSGNTLYVGGEWFTTAGGTPANRIAQWNINTNTWSALGSGLDGTVYALAVSGNTLYVGGRVTTAGGTPTNDIAQWDIDTNTWSALGSGLSGLFSRVNALAVSGNTLYVGGRFNTAGGTPANNIAQWNINTNTWSALGSGLSGLSSDVNALAVSGNTLYVGGWFNTAGGTPANHIAQWNINTNTWSALGSGLDRPVFALAVSGNTLYVGGGFTTAGGTPANRIAQWNINTNTWSALGSGLDGTVSALAVSGNTLYVGGGFNTAGNGIVAEGIAQWDSGTWSRPGISGHGMNDGVYAFEMSGNTLYVGGSFTTAGNGIIANRIARWDGSSWSALGGGMNDTVSALALSDNTLFVGGGFTTAGGTPANHIAQWNINTNTWSALGSGLSGFGLFSRVNALAVSGNMLYVGGEFNIAGGISANNIAQWDIDTNTWSALGSVVNGWVDALAVSGNTLYVGGVFTTAGGTPANFIAQWDIDTNTWSALGSGVDGWVRALAVSGNMLYVGGEFNMAGGISANNIAQWDIDTNTWSALGSGLGEVNALAVSGNTLYVGGKLTMGIAQWDIDTNTWSALGSGVNGWVDALAVSGNTLYVGGGFTTAGGKISPYAAKVNLPATTTHTLTVNSSGASGVAITANLSTYGGTTNYSRTGIASGTGIFLVAPAMAGNANFSSWTGCISTSGTGNRICNVAMTQNRAVTANYITPTTYTLSVNSSGASGVAITANPSTYSGTTNYNRTQIASGTSISLTAPATVGSANFSSWTGCSSTSGTGNRICNVAMTQNRAVTANFTSSSMTQRDILIAFYTATNGHSWLNRSGWLGAPGTECSWYGVTCDNGQVTELGLSSNQLSGAIPPELGQLSQLQWLSLVLNQLSGAIPPELAQLSQLQWLSLGSNQLSGAIPPELGQLSQLRGLYLDDNCLTATDPALIAFLNNLAPNWQASQRNDCPGYALTPLANGVPVNGLSGLQNSQQYFYIAVPTGATSLAITTTGGTGDVDLYVRRSSLPTMSQYDCRSNGGSNNETCTFANPTAGTYYILLHGAAAYSGVTLVATYRVAGTTYTLSVNSSGASGVAITANPSTYGGTTNYSRTQIASGTRLSLTAPATVGSASFRSWTGCGSTSGTDNRTCNVSLTENRTVTANFTSSGIGSDTAVIQQYYLAYYGRPADLGGLGYWLPLIQTASNEAARLAVLDAIRASFGAPSQAEFVAIYGQQVSVEAFFDRAYANILNRREQDADARAYWLWILNAQTQAHQNRGLRLEDAQAYARADLLSLLINAALAYPGTRDYDTFNNKQLMAAYATGRITPATPTNFLANVKVLLADPQIHTLSEAQLYAAVDALLARASANVTLTVAEAIPTSTTETAELSSASALTWSELPQGLQVLLSAHNALVNSAQLSADGTLIVFATEAALVGHDDNDYSDIYAYEVNSDRLTLISATATGQPGNGPSAQLIVAGDWMIYHTQATNLGAEGSGLYRHHRYTGQRELIGRDRWGQADPQASHPAATADGELIAYQRPDEYGRQHIYLTDTLRVERISVHADATLGLLDHCCAALSQDGHFIAYREQGTQGLAWLHILDRDTGQFTRLLWPDTLEHAPQFSHDGTELWWINPVQGLGQIEVLHRVDNPLR